MQLKYCLGKKLLLFFNAEYLHLSCSVDKFLIYPRISRFNVFHPFLCYIRVIVTHRFRNILHFLTYVLYENILRVCFMRINSACFQY